MSNVFKLVTMAGALTAIVLLIMMIIAITGGFQHGLSNPPS